MRPIPLLVFSAIVPATWVPWPLRSSGRLAVVDEVIALDELAGGEVGAAAEAAAERAVGDAGVEHRDGDAAARPGRLTASRFSQAPIASIPPGEVGAQRRSRGLPRGGSSTVW